MNKRHILFFMPSLSGGGAEQVTFNLIKQMNTEKYHVGNFITNKKGVKAYFTRCKSASASSLQCAIYMADVNKDGVFENVEKLSEYINEPGYNNTQITLAKTYEGKDLLIFASDRPGGYGNMDLWSSELSSSGKPKKARNLGKTINSPGNELSPSFYDSTSTLYFSSDWHAGLGGIDVFSTSFDENEEAYIHPTNLGRPINTPNDELFFSIKQDSSGAFMATNREGSFFIKRNNKQTLFRN